MSKQQHTLTDHEVGRIISVVSTSVTLVPGVYHLRNPVANPWPSRGIGWAERDVFVPGTYIVRKGDIADQFLLTLMSGYPAIWITVYAEGKEPADRLSSSYSLRGHLLLSHVEVHPFASARAHALASGEDPLPCLHSSQQLENLLHEAQTGSASSLRALAEELSKRGYGAPPAVKEPPLVLPAYPGRLDAREIRDVICSHTSYQPGELQIVLTLGGPPSEQDYRMEVYVSLGSRVQAREVFHETTQKSTDSASTDEALWLRIMDWIRREAR